VGKLCFGAKRKYTDVGILLHSKILPRQRDPGTVKPVEKYCKYWPANCQSVIYPRTRREHKKAKN
jgi:hypothetical protein